MSIRDLEKKRHSFSDLTQFNEDLRILVDFCQNFLSERANANGVYGDGEINQESLAILPEPKSMQQILDVFQSQVLDHGLNPTSGKFMGYIPGGGMPHAALGDFLSALTNRYAGVYAAGPGAATIENAVVEWFIDRLNLKDSTWGSLTSGGTTAILLCLIAARTRLDFKDWPRAVIYFSEETHHCLQRSLIVCGLGNVIQRAVPVDKFFKMDVQSLKSQMDQDRKAGLLPWMLVGNAGTVNTGAIDPLAALADVAKIENLWFHVDACYGGPFAMLSETQDRFQGLERCDSIALDPHKGFFQPYGLGAALVREGELLKEELSYSADYLKDVQDQENASPADYSIELTRHFRGLRLWLSLQRHGTASFEACQLEKIELAAKLHENLSELKHIEVGPKPSLSIVAFRLKEGSDAKQFEFLNRLKDQGFLVSSTKLHGRVFLRACILSFRSSLNEVKELVAVCSQFG